MTSNDFFWVVGLLEAEGSFGYIKKENRIYIALEMTDLDIVEKAKNLINGYKILTTKKHNHKIAYKTRVTGCRAISLMEQLLPYMSKRRSLQIKNALEKHIPNLKTDGYKKQRRFNQTIEQQVLLKKKQGYTTRELGKEYGVAHTTIGRIVKRLQEP